MKTLEETVNTKGVQYRLKNVGIQTIDIPSSAMVMQDDNTWGRLKKEGLYLTRMGDRKSSELSGIFDTDDPKQMLFVDAVDRWIEENPARAKANGIERLGLTRPDPRIDRWDSLDIDQIEAVVDALKPDLVWAFEFESKRSEELGGPREEVLELLEAFHKNGFTSNIEKSEEAPVI